mgnify:CR=1 FL=1
MWFNKKDLTIKPIIKIDDLHGYVLPHAGTTYTGQILSHTLRFRPTKKVSKDTPKTWSEVTPASKAKAQKEKNTKGRVTKY